MFGVWLLLEYLLCYYFVVFCLLSVLGVWVCWLFLWVGFGCFLVCLLLCVVVFIVCFVGFELVVI